MNNVLYRIKNIFFLFYLFGYIKLLPNIFECGFWGTLFLWLGVIYTLLMFVCYIKKDQILNNNKINNILSILMYLYIFLIACKYVQIDALDNFSINLIYFKINYIVASIITIGISINNILLKTKQ